MVPDSTEDFGRATERSVNAGLARHGLSLSLATLNGLQRRGIYCQPGISLEHQHLRKQYVLRATESGGAVADMGRYCAYLDMVGQPLPWLQPIDSIAVNGRHAVLIASELVRLEMLRLGHTYELAISSHVLARNGDRQRPVIASIMLLRGRLGTLALDLWKEENRGLRGKVAPIFYTRAGEMLHIPTIFEAAVNKITGAVCTIGCRQTHFAGPPAD